MKPAIIALLLGALAFAGDPFGQPIQTGTLHTLWLKASVPIHSTDHGTVSVIGRTAVGAKVLIYTDRRDVSTFLVILRYENDGEITTVTRRIPNAGCLDFWSCESQSETFTFGRNNWPQNMRYLVIEESVADSILRPLQ